MRGKLDIIVDILEIAKADVNKTRIVYGTNLNFKLADKYLSLLMKLGFMEKVEEKYRTTDKGKIILEKAREVTSQLGENTETIN
ncbi:MAG: transcriptional regulator [Candidatus Methanoperedens sp.]|nr:transcriptional regulator [Candidatus Methanoperedens sp.]